MDAAVIPLPREEVTPPVTKTYFAIARFSSGVFPILRISSLPRNPFRLVSVVMPPWDLPAAPGRGLPSAPTRCLWAPASR